MKYLYPTVLASLLALVQTQEHQVPITSHTVKDIPLLGYGTWNLAKSNASEAVTYAIETGYRHIDCAAAYGNEKKVGQGIAHGLQKAGLKRSDIWVTSKLWNDQYYINYSAVKPPLLTQPFLVMHPRRSQKA